MFRKGLIVLVCISLVASIWVALQNDRFARENRQVEIAVDHHEISEIIRRSGVDRDTFLHGLREWGVTSIAVRECSLEQLEEYSGSLLYMTGTRLYGEAHLWRADPALSRLVQQETIDPGSTYLLVDDARLAETLQHKITLKLNRLVDVTPLEKGVLLDMGYFVDPKFRALLDHEALQHYQELGFTLVPRPDNANLNSPEAVKDTLETFFSLEGISTVVFDGPQVTGHPGHLDQTAEFLEKSGRPVGVIKYIVPQHGMGPLMEKSGYPSVLVHSNYPKVPPVLIASSVIEDNIRLLYVRFDLNHTGNLAVQAENTLTAVTGMLQQRGYTFGPARPMAMTELSRGLLFILALGGVLAPGLFLLDRCLGIKNDKLFMILFLGGLLALAGALMGLNINTAARLLSLAAAIIFPALAVISLQLNQDSALFQLHGEYAFTSTAVTLEGARRVLGAFLKTIGLAVAGGIVAYAFTAGPYFLSGTAIYRGVKIAYLVPLVIVFIHTLFTVVLGENRWRLTPLVRLAGKTWKTPLELRHLLYLAVAGLAVYFYVLRSGHSDSVTLSAQEVQLRYFFLEHLVVRPRFKELLIGHPMALLALALVAWRGLRYPLVTGFAFCAGSIGVVSIVNSFSHFTTPPSISLIRTLNSLWLGLPVGAVVTALVLILLALMEARGGFEHEENHHIRLPRI